MKKLKEKKYRILGNILKFVPVLILGFILLSNVTFAITCPDGTIADTCPPAGVTIEGKIANPLGSSGPQDIPDFIKAVVKIVLVVGIPLLALAIIYAGFLFVKAQGNPEELTKAKNALLYAVIGGALLLGAFVIANAIQSTVTEIGKGV